MVRVIVVLDSCVCGTPLIQHRLGRPRLWCDDCRRKMQHQASRAWKKANPDKIAASRKRRLHRIKWENQHG